MHLSDLLAGYPGARLATAADNRRILEFFEASAMDTSAFRVEYRRSPDFFRLLRYQADRAYVIVGEDHEGRIRSVGTVSVRPAWMGGEATTVAYLGDLRIGFDRHFVAAWRRFYGELVSCSSEIDELADCRYWLTTILDENRLARAALTREHHDAPTHLPLAHFTMRNIIGRIPVPGGRRGRSSFRIQQATAADREALIDFTDAVNRRVPFGFRGELERRLRTWDDFSLEDFSLAVDPDGEIVACVAPWSPSLAKQTVVSRVPAAYKIAGLAAHALPGRPIVRIPRAGEAMRILYLTHVQFAARLADGERVTVFRQLLDHVFDRRRDDDWHFFALCDFDSWGLGRGLGGFVQQTVPITIYSVHPPGTRATEVAVLTDGIAPGFEMALV